MVRPLGAGGEHCDFSAERIFKIGRGRREALREFFVAVSVRQVYELRHDLRLVRKRLYFHGIGRGLADNSGDFPHALGKPLPRDLQRPVPRSRLHPYEAPHSAAANFNRSLAVENAAEG